MSGKQKRISISSSTIFMKVDGVVQRVRPGQEITGVIAKDLEVNFKLVAKSQPEAKVHSDAEEIAELKKWLDEHKVSYQPNTGVKKLRKYKADKEEELTAPDPE